MTPAEILALPRSQAFEDGHLVPVSPWTRKNMGLPVPVRFTAAAFDALVAYPGPHGGAPLPRTFPRREQLVLQALTNCMTYLGLEPFRIHRMDIALPDWIGPARHMRPRAGLSMRMLLTTDEEAQEVLTILSQHEVVPA